jgi:hypothetical protein
MLEPLGSNLWIADGGIVSFKGFDYPTRMAVVRLADGGCGCGRRSKGRLRFERWDLFGISSAPIAKFRELHLAGSLTDEPPLVA